MDERRKKLGLPEKINPKRGNYYVTKSNQLVQYNGNNYVPVN